MVHRTVTRRRDAGEDVSTAAACAKMFASETVGRVADRNLQVHGGNGHIREYRAEQLFRDARLYRIYEGTTQIPQTIVARALVAETRAKLGLSPEAGRGSAGTIPRAAM